MGCWAAECSPSLLKKPAAVFSSAGAEGDEVVGGGDDVGVVLNDEHGVAGVAEAEDGSQELFDVVEVEAGGGFVEEY